jgi:hypothetical protein
MSVNIFQIRPNILMELIIAAINLCLLFMFLLYYANEM